MRLARGRLDPFLLEGDARMAGKDPANALTAYQAGLKIAPAPELMVRVLSNLRSTGRNADAERQADVQMHRPHA